MPRIQPYWLGPRWTRFPSQNGTEPANGWITQLPGEKFRRGKASFIFHQSWHFSSSLAVLTKGTPPGPTPHAENVDRWGAGTTITYVNYSFWSSRSKQILMFDHISNLTLLLSSIANILNRQIGEDQVVASSTLNVILAKNARFSNLCKSKWYFLILSFHLFSSWLKIKVCTKLLNNDSFLISIWSSPTSEGRPVSALYRRTQTPRGCRNHSWSQLIVQPFNIMCVI